MCQPGNQSRWRRRLDRLMDLACRERRRWGPGLDHTPSDLASEAARRLIQRWRSSWSRPTRFEFVAARTTRDAAIDRMRALRTRRLLAPRAHLTTDRPTNQAQPIDRDHIRDALARLDEDTRAVIECRLARGLTIEQTAACLGRSRATIARTWARAKAELTPHLRPGP